MKKVVCDHPFRLSLVDVADPEPDEDEALVRIERIGISGTDLQAFSGQQPFFSYPRVLGHELTGEILEVPENVYGLHEGDSVVVLPYVSCGVCIACRRGHPNCCSSIDVLGVHSDGGMCERMAVPIDHLVPVVGLDADQRALVECLSIGAHASRRGAPESGETTIVLGADQAGLAVLQFAQRSAARIIVIDADPSRLAFVAEHFDVETVVADTETANHIDDLTEGDLATLVFETTGNAKAMRDALSYVAHSGRLVWVGWTPQELAWPYPELHRREATLIASRHAQIEDFVDVIAGIADGSILSSCLITHRTGIDDVTEQFAHWARRDSGVIKALVEI